MIQIYSCTRIFGACGVLFEGTSVMTGISEFIAYSPAVPIVRLSFIMLGSLVVVAAFVYWWTCRICNRPVIVYAPDHVVLPVILAAMILVPFLCYALASATRCEFWQFQHGVSFALMVTGCFFSVRTRRFRYILYYLISYLLLGGTCPPT